MSARLLAAIALGLGLAVVGSLAIAGSSYTPPAASGGVEGDGTGVTDASAFRAALGLGTAATLTAGTAANNAVQLDGDGKLPAVDGSALTNVSAAAPSASAVPYAPASAGDWTNPDPTEVAGALDTLASRVVAAETQAAPSFKVCPSGCEYSTVQAAVTAAAGTSPTDGQSAVIQVYPGTYSESVTLAPHIAIVGMGGESHNFPVISGKVTADYGSASGPYQMAVSLSRMRISSPAGDYGIDFTGSGAQALHLQDVAVYMGSTGKGVRVNNSGSQGGLTSIVYADNIIVHGAGANANAGIELSAGRVNFTGPVRLYSPVYAPALAISGTGLAWQTAGNIAMDGSMTYSSSAASSFISLSGTVASGAIISQSAGTLLLGQIGGYSATPSQAAVVSRSGTGVCLYSLGQINGYGYLAPTTGGCSALTGNGLYAAFQGLDSELTALASTTSAADALPYFTGAGTASTTTLTSAGRDLIDDASAADMRTTLGLGSAATLTSGTAAGNVVTLDGSAKLPAVDGSALTGISTSPYAADEWDAVWKAADGLGGWTTAGGVSTTEIATVDGKSAATMYAGSSFTGQSYFTLTTAPDQSFELRMLVHIDTTMANNDPNAFIGFGAFGKKILLTYAIPGITLYTANMNFGTGYLGSGVLTSDWALLTIRVTSPDVGNTSPTAIACGIQVWLGDQLATSYNLNPMLAQSLAGDSDGKFQLAMNTTTGPVSVAWVAYRSGHNDALPSYTYRGMGYAASVAAPSVSP